MSQKQGTALAILLALIVLVVSSVIAVQQSIQENHHPVPGQIVATVTPHP